MSQQTDPLISSRRSFLKNTAMLGGGLMIGLPLSLSLIHI